MTHSLRWFLIFAIACGGSSPTVQDPSDRDPSATREPVRTGPPAAIGSWGFALGDMDRGVDPGDDFYAYANGKWLENFEIPSDFSNYGAFTVLIERAEERVRSIVEDAKSAEAEEGTHAQRIGDFYTAYLDTDRIEALGWDAAKADLEALGALRTREAVARAMGRPDLGLEAPIGFWVDLDAKNTDRYVVNLTQAGLGLPDRDYYLEANFADERAAYGAYVQQVLEMGGIERAETKAQAILALETKIAEAHWPRAKTRDRDLTYNLMARSDLPRLAPGFPWAAYAEESGFAGEDDLNVRERDAIQKLAALFGATPVATWTAYLQFHYLNGHADVLPQALDEAHFALYGKTLSGTPEQRDRWKRGVIATNDALGEAVGRLYVERHFPPEAKAQMEALVENVKRAFRERLAELDWMSDETKAQALAKLEAFRAKIAYPDVWEEYEGLVLRADDALGNAKRVSKWQHQDEIAKLGGPVDRNEWFMTPQTVNAYYSGLRNEIVFPAAILQPPFFDPNADPAVNYGGIGAVIGHEIGHGFDDQGRKSDGRGMLRDWWTAEDKTRFEGRAQNLGAQYGGYEPIADMPLNPELTMGENIGDLGGLTLAHHAYHLALNGEAAPVLDGFTGEQRFFLAWAQVWKRKYREAELRQRIVTDPHSPSEFRTNGIVRNMDAWYEAFGVEAGDDLYLPPEARVAIW